MLPHRKVEALVFTVKVIKYLEKNLGCPDAKGKRYANSKIKELAGDTMVATKKFVPQAISAKLQKEYER